MSCELGWNPIDVVGGCIGAAFGAASGTVGDMASSIFTSILDVIVSAMAEALGWMITNLGTFWLSVPAFTSAFSSDPSSAVGFMWSRLHWYLGALLIFSVLFGAGKIILARRSQPGVELAKSLMTFALVVGAGLPTIAALAEAADLFSSWIIDQATGDDFTAGLKKIVGVDLLLSGGLGTTIVMIIGGLLAVLASIVQIMLLVMRSAMMVLLASILPIAAATTNTQMGQQWFTKTTAWLLAFILYKPVASIIYALAFRLVSGNGGGEPIMGLLTGFTLMVLSLLALPALMRFMVPAVAHTAGGAGFGAVMGAMIAGGSAMAGARMMMGGSSGSSGASGGSGPTGAVSSGGRGAAGASGPPGPPRGPGPWGSSGAAGGGAAAGGAAAKSGAAKGAASAAGGAASMGATVAAQYAAEKAGAALSKPGQATSQAAGEG